MGKKRKRPAPPRCIVVARNAYPIEVGVQPNGADSVLSFLIGPPVNTGGRIPLENVLDWEGTGLNPQFNEEFRAGGLDWLVPLLVRLHAGEDVTDEIKAAYQERHGKPPEMMR